jgi:hypothetical protein
LHRLAAPRGTKRAAVAVGHTILVVADQRLADPAVRFRDLGPHDSDQRDRAHVTRRLVRRIDALGYQVVLSPSSA